MDSAALFAPVREPSAEARGQFAHFAVAAPAGQNGLGQLSEPGAWLAACQEVHPPRPITRPRVLIFAGDHGVNAQGVDTRPEDTSRQLAEQITSGQAPLNSLAAGAGAGVRLVDVSLAHEAWGPERVAEGSGRIDIEDGLSREQLEKALEVGSRVADEEVDSGAELLIPGSLGMAAETVAAAVAGALTRTEPVVMVGAGYGISEAMWKQRVGVIRDAMFRVHSDISQPLEVMRKISSPDIVALAAFCAQAAVRRTPVLIDGPVPALAALLADRLAPGARAWFYAAQDSGNPVETVALRDLGLSPLLDLDFDFGPGSAALLALPLLQTAGQLAREAAGTQPEPN
ncbi:Nicotinate-nucleotide--dimethylbenzimidazole phosphoribosyltransferase [Corynebacterium occultum]|uniref:Nicotinate-nucleotide--dimethylbenzimidazole phosphoribosyltransferase n=1 Tax=Corynebacterium occultum TaxID=2675219 RepID=A0A6B8W5J9_9CORY|nr:nicotinate-nucleotide--dimethylbenzimidazole phosphoribosyltransferase [Corynebacterium occultum]QGU07841.1 Nicotinate-nucleotide--dimethylbenzimidazole phosphoribosyltransferase [Corynebacterium occultum]